MAGDPSRMPTPPHLHFQDSFPAHLSAANVANPFEYIHRSVFIHTHVCTGVLIHKGKLSWYKQLESKEDIPKTKRQTFKRFLCSKKSTFSRVCHETVNGRLFLNVSKGRDQGQIKVRLRSDHGQIKVRSRSGQVSTVGQNGSPRRREISIVKVFLMLS